jgi:hypothetical protein
MSKSAPKPYRADKTVLGDTLAVRFNATYLPKAKAMLAESLRAKWREEKDAWVLYRTPETLKAFETEEYALREASVRASIAAAAKSGEEKFDAAPVAEEMSPFSPKIEQWRLKFGEPVAIDPLEAMWARCLGA